MKNIEIDDDLYQYIVGHTEVIGESASTILRRLLNLSPLLDAVEDTHSLDKKVAINNQLEESASLDDAKASLSIFDHIKKDELMQLTSINKRFLLMLSILYQDRKEQFEQVLAIRGKGRLYFAKDKQTLEASGSSTRPKQIQNSPYWVTTNTNTARKKSILARVAQTLGHNEQNTESICQLLIAELS